MAPDGGAGKSGLGVNRLYGFPEYRGKRRDCVRPQFDPAAFRPLAEKLKFFETLPESRVEELSFARYAARPEVVNGQEHGVERSWCTGSSC